MYTKEILYKHFLNYKRFILKQMSINMKFNIKTRHVGFPDHISENLIKFILHKINNNTKCSWECFQGDLTEDNLRLECKCITSNCPITFGRRQKWDKLYILDARNWLTSKLFLYEINIKSDSEKWKNLMVTKKSNFGNKTLIMCPKISFSSLQKQLGKDLNCIYSGSINNILSNKKVLKNRKILY